MRPLSPIFPDFHPFFPNVRPSREIPAAFPRAGPPSLLLCSGPGWIHCPNPQQFLQIEGGTNPRPFGSHFFEAAQEKAPNAHGLFDDAENSLDHGRSFPVDLHAGFGGHAPPGEFQSRLIEEKGGKKQAEACTLTLLEYRLQPASASFHDSEILLGDEALLALETLWRNGRGHLLFPHAGPFDPSQN